MQDDKTPPVAPEHVGDKPADAEVPKRQGRRKKSLIFAAVLVLLVAVAAIGAQRRAARQEAAQAKDTSSQQTAAANYDLEGWADRPYRVYLPADYKNLNNMPVMLVLHGGGSNISEQEKLTCPGGDLDSPKCLTKVATDKNFAVVYVSGTRTPRTKDTRTFNAGGGEQGYRCVSTYACENKIDDIAYFKDLIAGLATRYKIDQQRIFATGMSNGAAMAHRLACELSENVKAIAPVGGGNQLTTLQACTPARAVSVLEIHGTADPAWPYDGGMAGIIGDKGIMASTPKTIEGWATTNGCSAASTTESADNDPNDKASLTVQTYTGCKDNSRVVLYTINGGGHTWPQGNQYLPESKIGPTAQEINANQLMVNFFATSQ